MSIFYNYPYINYNNQKAVYILAKAQLITNFLNDYRKFYDYNIKEGERADVIAYKEYNDSSLDWIIYVVNGIIDPYKDWPLDDKQFISYMEDKYQTNSYKLASTNIATSIDHYYYTGTAVDSEEDINSYNYTISPETYAAIGSPAGWTAKSIWEKESELNESKRNIVLLRKVYLSDFKDQFRKLFING